MSHELNSMFKHIKCVAYIFSFKKLNSINLIVVLKRTVDFVFMLSLKHSNKLNSLI